MQGIYEILNFLTGDNLFTHQLPRAMKECEPWLRILFPALMEDSPLILRLLPVLDAEIANADKDRSKIETACNQWVEMVRAEAKLPEMLSVYEMGSDMHTYIDPVEEAEAMVGKDRVIVIKP